MKGKALDHSVLRCATPHKISALLFAGIAGLRWLIERALEPQLELAVHLPRG